MFDELPPTGPRAISRYEGAYEWLSNFYPCAIPYKGAVYPSVEHAYQASKFDSESIRNRIRTCGPAREAKKLAKELFAKHGRSDWSPEVKKRMMAAFNWFKFGDGYLQRKLLSTDGKTLIEGNEWGDRFWGVSGGYGENNLGLIQMELRLQKHFEGGKAATARFNPWHGVYDVPSVQRNWEMFKLGAAAACGCEQDWRKVR